MHRIRYALAVLGVFAVLAPCARAAHVVPMDLARMADHAGQVIIGEVTTVRSYWADAPRRIESEIEFGDVRYLKGALDSSTTAFTLRVPGGTVGETQMRLCCAPEFRAGQRWLLFLLPSSQTYPIVGLYQGAMRIETDDQGVERVLAADGRSVVGIDDEGYLRLTGPPVAHRRPTYHAAHNLRIAPRTDSTSPRPMRLDAVMATLTPILDASRDHHLSAAAGQYLPAPYTATDLKPATGHEPPPRAASSGDIRGRDGVRAAPGEPGRGRSD